MATIDIISTQIFTAMRSYLLTLAPSGAEVVQGLQNQVAMPKGDFAVMTPLQMIRLATNVPTYDPLGGEKSIETAFRFNIQVDIYGPNSQPWAAMAKSLFRDEYAIDMFPSNIVPLYADDAVQMPLIDGEDQYEFRWKTQMSVQYNPKITVSQDFATALNVELVEVDAAFKP